MQFTVGGQAAAQTGTWHGGTNTRIDLTAGSGTAATPVPATATASPTPSATPVFSPTPVPGGQAAPTATEGATPTEVPSVAPSSTPTAALSPTQAAAAATLPPATATPAAMHPAAVATLAPSAAPTEETPGAAPAATIPGAADREQPTAAAGTAPAAAAQATPAAAGEAPATESDGNLTPARGRGHASDGGARWAFAHAAAVARRRADRGVDLRRPAGGAGPCRTVGPRRPGLVLAGQRRRPRRRGAWHRVAQALGALGAPTMPRCRPNLTIHVDPGSRRGKAAGE